jgi:CMP-2-keto-3-deoxyoctulosonic acid synthetase
LNWLAVTPEIVLLGMACVVAIMDLFVTCPQRKPTYFLTMLSLAVVAGLHLSALDSGASVYAMQRMVVTDAMGRALYFSRAPIPWWRDAPAPATPAQGAGQPLRHIGIYGYRAGFLRRFPTLPQAPLEKLESLEQLRALYYGERIAVMVLDAALPAGVDTQEDLDRVRAIFEKSAPV